MTKDAKGDVQVSPCLKWFLFSVNFFFWILSILLVLNSMYQFSLKESAGLTSAFTATVNKVKSSKIEINSKEAAFADALVFLSDVSMALLCVGIVLFIVTFFGFLGALRENRCLLTGYNLLLFLLIIAKGIGLGYIIWNVTIKSKPEELARKMIESKVDEYNRYDNDALVALIDFMQMYFECCGTSQNGGYPWNIWNQNPDYTCDPRNQGPFRCSVPPSCCKKQAVNDLTHLRLCGRDVINIDQGFGEGFRQAGRSSSIKTIDEIRRSINTSDCASKVAEWVDNSILVIGIVFVSLIVAQVFALVAADSLKGQILECERRFKGDYPRRRHRAQAHHRRGPSRQQPTWDPRSTPVYV